MRRSVDLIPYMLFMAARDWLADSSEWLPQTDLEMIPAADDPEPVAD